MRFFKALSLALAIWTGVAPALAQVGAGAANGGVQVPGFDALVPGLGVPAAIQQTLNGTGPLSATTSPAFLGTPTAPTQPPGDNTNAIATDAFVQAAAVTFMGRNRIINGDMTVDQRNGGSSGTAAAYTVDRWQYGATQASKLTWGQNLNAVTSAPGFGKYLGIQSSSSYAVLAADYFLIQQSIEGFNTQDFQWGTANAQPVTISFWVQSSLTGTFAGNFRDYAGTRAYVFTYAIPVANTWTKIAVTVPGDTAGSWVGASAAGAVSVRFSLGCGTTASTTAGSWQAGGYLSATGAVNVVGTNGATWYVTGIQLEIGSVATPFERKSAQQNLADCQRYYEVINNLAGTFNAGGASTQYPVYARFAVQKRAVPTVTTGAPTTSNCSISYTAFVDAINFTATSAAAGFVGWYTTVPITASAEL
jgi:hypothetical protein